eukprot:14763522-Heterocapsa_arctica.AAC.1
MDDIYLFAATAGGLQHMMSQTMAALAQHELRVQPDKTQWSITRPDDESQVVIVAGLPLELRSCSEGLLVLGSQVSFAGYAHVATAHRFGRAWQSFFSNRE